MRCRLAAVLACVCLLPTLIHAADWPTYRYDATRSSATTQALPAKLHLQWTRELPPLKPAWPDQPKAQLDSVYEPVVLGQLLFVPSSRTDSVTAYDTRTGEEKWRYYTQGPIRYAPAAWEGRVYAASDDGYLYCLDAAKGTLNWKVRGGPIDRYLLGNERLISTWPARGAPVIDDGKVYFAAGIWPFMGTFLHCRDARTGDQIWLNDGDGSIYIKQPHQTDSFAGVAPQGPMVISGDKLIIPGGRSTPAVYDKKTGKLLRYQLADNGKNGGGLVAASERFFFNGGQIFVTATEKHMGNFGEPFVLGDTGYGWTKGVVKGFNLTKADVVEEVTMDKKGGKGKNTKLKLDEVGSLKAPGWLTFIRAGKHLIAGTEGAIEGFDADLKTPKSLWKIALEGTPASLIAADDRLFVITREGAIHCFAAEEIKSVKHALPAAARTPNDWTKRAEEIIKATNLQAGYALVLGLSADKGRLMLAELAHASKLHLIGLDADAEKVQQARKELGSLYGERVSVLHCDPATVQMAPYFASLIVCEDGTDLQKMSVANAYQWLRPFGGTLCFAGAKDMKESLEKSAQAAKLESFAVRPNAVGTLVVREGPLPGSANWTHEHADSANTRVSKDILVKAPLGVLWWGGTSNEGVLPRHGHGPQPQVIDGRLFIEGVDMMRAMDIYTGRLLWESKLPGVGAFYNNLAHQPGANAGGTNFISTREAIYVVYGNSCVKLDPVTGKKDGYFTLPKLDGKEPPKWGYINVVGDLLIGGADPLYDPKLVVFDPKAGDDPEPGQKKAPPKGKTPKVGEMDNLTSSKHLTVMDRHTGKVLWSASARSGFRHNAICAGGDKLFVIDRLSGPEVNKLKRRGEFPKFPPQLIAFDLKTGRELWKTETEVFGTWLSYSIEKDVVIECGRNARDTVSDEPKGMRAYDGKGGKELWFQKTYIGPAMIHGDTILKDQSACDLMTGTAKTRPHPLTDKSVPWSWIRNYGCNTPMAAEFLMTFRSGAAGFLDLCNDGGTGNFGGFRSSCTNNLVVAGGILTAPDYTRTCSCLYQNQTSLAMVHMPDAEMWTSFGKMELNGPVKRVGLNLAAPGDRRADSGTLWLEFPSVGGQSPTISAKLTPAQPQQFRWNAARVEGDGLKWVCASGMQGLTNLTVTLGKKTDDNRLYTLRLYFMEPDGLAPGKRQFSISAQGKELLKDLDVSKEAGGPGRTLMREFKGIEVRDDLALTFRATVGQSVLCGVEVVQEEGKK